MVNRWERFRQYKAENPDIHERSFGLARGQHLPTHEEMDEMARYRLPYDIDPEIRQPVIDLNRQGIRTCGSCAGHPGVCGAERGFISIGYEHHERQGTAALHPEVEERIKQTLRSHGLQRVTVDSPSQGRPYVPVKFAPVGRGVPKRRRNG